MLRQKRIATGKPGDWPLDQAVTLYQSGFGVKAVAKQTGIPRSTLKVHLRATIGVRPYTGIAPNKGKRSSKKWNTGRIIIADYARESSALRKFDEQHHWKGHPLFQKFKVMDGEWVPRSRFRYLKSSSERSNYWFAKKIRSRVYRVLKGQLKSAPTLTLLGCSLDQFRSHLQARFKPGMSWNNYGRVWHMDHREPCAAFDLSKPEQQRRCFHFSNIVPEYALANIRKSARIVPTQRELLIIMNP